MVKCAYTYRHSGPVYCVLDHPCPELIVERQFMSNRPVHLPNYSTLLEFWFGRKEPDSKVIEEKSSLWWDKDEKTDAYIRTYYSDLLARAAQGLLNDWLNEPRGYLAVIILLDQFSRNIYRNSPRAFSQDEQALDLAMRGTVSAVDKKLTPVERVFFYLPFEHSESVAVQERSVSLYQGLLDEVADADKVKFIGYLDFAVKHVDIVKRFKRFPHRNEILGRTSTQAEIEFLQQPDSSF